MKIKQQISALSAALAMTLAHNVQAVDLKWSGFLNTIGARTNDSAVYLHDEGNIDDNGSFEESTLGLNAIVTVSEHLSLAAQIASAPSNNSIDFDWGFGTYNLNENWAIKAGRVKFPGMLVSEYVRVGYAYPWIRPPEAVYSASMAAPAMGLDAYDGGALVYQVFGDNFDYSAEVYGGGRATDMMDFDKMYGLVLRASNDILTLVGSANWSTMAVPGSVDPMMAAMMNDIAGQDMLMLNAGVTADWNDFVLYAEYVRSTSDFVDTMGRNDSVDITSWYTTLGYRFGNLMPHVTYQSLEHGNGGLEQTGWTAGLRYDLGRSTALKLEWQRIEPKEANAGANVPMMLKNQFGLFEHLSTPSDEVDLVSVAVNFTF